MPTVIKLHERNALGNWRVADVIVGMAPLLIGAQLLAWVFFIPAALQGHSSFRQLYTAGYMVRAGHAHELYDYGAQKSFQDRLVSPEPMMMPFIRPPFDALAYVALSVLSYRSAYLLLFTLNVGMVALSLFLLRPYTEQLRSRYRWLPVILFASFVPLGSALMMGQDSILLLALLILSMLALDKKKDAAAGIFAGLGLFKFHIVLPLAFLLLFWKRFRFFTAFLCVAMALAGISLWLVGPEQVRLYVDSLLSIGSRASGGNQLLRYPLPVSMMPNIHGLIEGTFGGHVRVGLAIGIIVVIALATFIWVAISLPSQSGATWAVPVAITTSVFMSYYLFVYDLPVLLLPLAIGVNQSLRPERSSSNAFIAWTSVLLILSPACLLFFGSHFYLVSLLVLLFLIALVQSAKKECRDQLVAK
jgi:hypothetical protein